MTELLEIKELVERAKGERAQNLASAINEKTLKAAHQKMDPKKAVGVDGVSKDVYALRLDQNVQDLTSRMKRQAYKPQPSRRTYIDKPGTNKRRPLGISAYEDKLVEHVIAQLLEIVYDPKFIDVAAHFPCRRDGVFFLPVMAV